MDTPILLPCQIDVLDMIYRSPREGAPSTCDNTFDYLESSLRCCSQTGRLKPSLQSLEKEGYIISKKVEGEQNFYITPKGERVHEYLTSPKTVNLLDAEKLVIEAIKAYKSAGIPGVWGPTDRILRVMLYPHGLDGDKVMSGRYLAIRDKKIQRVLVTDEDGKILSEQYAPRVSKKEPDTVKILQLTRKPKKTSMVRTKQLR